MMSKYGSIKTVIDGITFDSKKEARRYAELKLLQRGKQISCLELQPRFKIVDGLKINGHKKMSDRYYIADFMYLDKDGNTIVEDVKGVKTAVYTLKKHLFLSLFGKTLTFREI